MKNQKNKLLLVFINSNSLFLVLLYLMCLRLVQNTQCYLNTRPSYDLTPSSLDKWVGQSQKSGSFKEKDHLTAEQKELMELRKRNKQLEMENDILKQVALILGRK